MNEIFEGANSIKTPIALCSLIMIILFLIYKQIVAKNIFSKLTGRHSALVMSLIIICLALLVFYGLYLVFQNNHLPSNQGDGAERAEIERLTNDLESNSLAIRMLAASQFDDIHAENSKDLILALRVLESFINQKGSAIPFGDLSVDKSDIATALHSLGGLLKKADEHSVKIKYPEFSHVNLSGLDLSNIYLSNTTFSDSDFSNAMLNGSNFSNVALIGVRFSRVQAKRINLSASRIKQSCFEESNLSGANIMHADVVSSDFNGVSFSDADLSYSNFNNSRFSLAEFNGAVLDQSNFKGALELTTQQIAGIKHMNTASLPSPLFKKSNLSICKID